jgi:tubulin-specific chaperone D
VIDFMQLMDEIESKDSWLWSLRYVTLLWLSLICMLPFDLAQFDEPGQQNQTALAVEEFGKSNLGRAGLERDGAALLLSRLYAR